jgi:hypothetical protein
VKKINKMEQTILTAKVTKFEQNRTKEFDKKIDSLAD